MQYLIKFKKINTKHPEIEENHCTKGTIFLHLFLNGFNGIWKIKFFNCSKYSHRFTHLNVDQLTLSIEVTWDQYFQFTMSKPIEKVQVPSLQWLVLSS